MARKFSLVCVLVGCLGLMLAGPVAAQTISHPLGNRAIEMNRVGIGQEFQATITGTVTKIRVRPIGTHSTTLRFYDVSGGSGVQGSIGTPTYSQAVNLVDGGSVSTGFQEIILATPLPVTAGEFYSFTFDLASLATHYPSQDANYYFLRDYIQAAFVFDLSFEVVQEPPAAVPTLSEWAMILMGLMLAGGAGLMIQRRQPAV
jgi:hypothetical protein